MHIYLVVSTSSWYNASKNPQEELPNIEKFKKTATEPWNTKVASVTQQYHVRKNTILTEPQNTEARLKLNWPWYLYTNELPHLPLVTFLQSSH